MKRRQVLALAGGTVTVALAGCAGDSDEANGDNQTNGDDGAMVDDDEANGVGNGNDTENGGDNGMENGGDNGMENGGEVPSEVDDYLANAGEYDGSVEDMTGEDSATVEVGAGSDGVAFAPAAIRVDSGTAVTWEWTGEGGQHNVVHDDGDFESELVEEEGHTFEHTFEDEANYLYYCEPHQSVGMKGAVIVGSGAGNGDMGGNGGAGGNETGS